MERIPTIGDKVRIQTKSITESRHNGKVGTVALVDYTEDNMMYILVDIEETTQLTVAFLPHELQRMHF